jgi:circadian clock protein KaiC
LTLLHWPPVEIAADALADQLLATLDHTRAQRLVVDSISVIERAVAEGSDVHRVQGYLAALVTALQARRVTALFTKETGPFAGTALELETDLSSGVAENVLWLQGIIYLERFYRVLSVLKMRYSAHDLTLREFTITAPEGIEVRPAGASMRGVMAGIARQQGDPLRDHPPTGPDGQPLAQATRSSPRRRARPAEGSV